jgi:hypothetical protein
VSQYTAGDVPLPSGRMTSGIVRREDRVLRPAGPWSPAVHEYLLHLESAGFGGSPRVLGVDGGFEVPSYLAGDVAADPLWQPGHGHRLPAFARTERALRGAAALLRGLHAASAGFRPARTECRCHPFPPRAGEISRTAACLRARRPPRDPARLAAVSARPRARCVLAGDRGRGR